MPTSSHLPPQSPAENAVENTCTTLKALERLFHPNASTEDALLGRAIRTMARYIRVDGATRNQDLSLLLEISIALERAGRQEAQGVLTRPPV